MFADDFVPAPDLYGPFQYLPWWVLGLLILLGLALLATAAWALTRPRGILEPPPPPPAFVDVRLVKEKYLRLIDEVAEEHARGELTPRTLSQRLSLVLRFFAHETTGVQAEVMTLEDLEDAELPQVRHAVSQYYPGSFQRVARHDPPAAIELARRVVSTWM